MGIPSKPRYDAPDYEERWKNAIALGELHGIKCTGSPWAIVCENPGALGVVLHGRLWSIPCREHSLDIPAYIMERGHGSCRVESLAVMIEEHGAEAIKRSADVLRERNHAHGISLPPGAYIKKKKP